MSDSRSHESVFSSDELYRIVAETFVAAVDHHPQLGSSNDRAAKLLSDPQANFPLLVLTDSQTAGRGRGCNVWWSSDGALTFSLALATDVANLPAQRWPQVSLTAGLAVCEALEQILTRGVPAQSASNLPKTQLKWPNDVYLTGQKICGILVEAPPTAPGKLIVGIGINVNNSVEGAPAEVQQLATSLVDLTGQSYRLADVLIEVLKQLALRLEPDHLWSAEVLDGWRSRCFLSDKRIEIDNGTRKALGICRGIDESGALLLEAGGQVEKHLAGTIMLV